MADRQLRMAERRGAAMAPSAAKIEYLKDPDESQPRPKHVLNTSKHTLKTSPELASKAPLLSGSALNRHLEWSTYGDRYQEPPTYLPARTHMRPHGQIIPGILLFNGFQRIFPQKALA